MAEAKQMQTELEKLNVDQRLHTVIVKKFAGLISLDVISFTIFSVVLGVFTFAKGFHIVPGIFFALCMLGLIWNLKSMIAVMMKKYDCYQVTVDRVWEEKGVYLCRIAPDAYDKYDFTTDIIIKNYTKKYKEIESGDKVIVATGKFSRYIYIFDYDGDIMVTQRLKLDVTENPLNTNKKTSGDADDNIREELIERVGTVYFGVKMTDDGVYYQHKEGLDGSMFGPHLITSVAGCHIPENRFDDAIEAIEATYRNSDIILESFYDMALRTINNEMTMSPLDGEIDKDYIREQFIIEEMDVSIYNMYQDDKDDIEISFYGNVETDTGERLLNGKELLIHINCSTGDVNYALKDF